MRPSYVQYIRTQNEITRFPRNPHEKPLNRGTRRPKEES